MTRAARKDMHARNSQYLLDESGTCDYISLTIIFIGDSEKKILTHSLIMSYIISMYIPNLVDVV